MLEFIQDGGYDQRDLWTDEGWKWKEFRQARLIFNYLILKLVFSAIDIQANFAN